LCFQVGEFYESIGVDACVLVEYAGLNPFGGLRSDSVPRAGCPVMVSYIFFSIDVVLGFSCCINEYGNGCLLLICNGMLN
jgi:hypothetical protein